MSWKYTELEIEEAVKAWVVTGNYARAGRDVGMPESTVRWWVEKRPDLVGRFRKELEESSIESFARWLREYREKYGPKWREDIAQAIDVALEKLANRRTATRDIPPLIKEIRQTIQWMEGEGPELGGGLENLIRELQAAGQKRADKQ